MSSSCGGFLGCLAIGNLIFPNSVVYTRAQSLSFLLIKTESIFFNYGNNKIVYNLKLLIESIGFPWIVKEYKCFKWYNYSISFILNI